MEMFTMIACSSCTAKLKVPNEAMGTSIKCPRCLSMIATIKPQGVEIEEEFEVLEEDTDSPYKAAGNTKPSSSADEIFPSLDMPKKKKKKKKKKESSKVDTVLEILTNGKVVGLISFVVFFFLGYYLVQKAMRVPPPDVIPAEKWQPVEVANRFKGLLPGPAIQQTQSAQGMRTILHMHSPHPADAYGIGYSDTPLPAHRKSLPVEQLLNDACDGSMGGVHSMGFKVQEISRESITLGNYPGKQQVFHVPSFDARMISRIFIAHDRLYMVIAYAPGLELDHEHVKRLFDAFEITEVPEPPKEPKAPEKKDTKPAEKLTEDANAEKKE